MTSSNFQQAQQRVLTRRRQRDAQLQAQQFEFSSSGVTADGLPFPLRGLRRTSSLTWSRLRSREGTRPAFRVGQVDAELLDEELLDLLQDQVGEGLRLFNAHFRQEYSAEILLALRAILFKLSIWDHNTTYGAALQNLRYADSRKTSLGYVAPSRIQKALYGLVSIGGRYAWTKWDDWLTATENGAVEPSNTIHLLSRATSTATLLHSIAALTSFLIFLVDGKYRTLLDRVLYLRLTAKTSHLRREVSFEYMNRQLVWHAFTEFLLFVLPLVGINRWRRWLARVATRIRTFLRPGARSPLDEKPRGELAFLPERTCAICYRDQNVDVGVTDQTLGTAAGGVVGSALTDATNPYEATPCGCVFCYVCLAQLLEASEGDGWVCLRCGRLVQECRPWNGDVLDPTMTAVQAPPR